AGRTTARAGTQVAPADVAEYRRARARDVLAPLPVDDDRNLHAAGIDPQLYRDASEKERGAMRTRSEDQLRHERALVAAAGDNSAPKPDPRELRLDPTTLRTRTRAERERLRAERVERRARPTSRTR